jgi:uncharacterized protein (TIGR02147 family)
MPNVFEYTNYRKYLKRYYETKKKKHIGFSYTTFAEKAGFKNKGFFYQVIQGQKNLSKKSILKISHAIGHTSTESEYFENLVFYNQGSDREERNHYLHNLLQIKSRVAKTARALRTRRDQYEYYTHWYHSAVRAWIDLHPFKDDYALLARSLYPAITAFQAKKSVQLLERLQLVKQDDNGYYYLTEKHITTGNEIIDSAALNFHYDCTKLAAAAINKLPKTERNVTGMTLGISQQAYEKVCEAAREFRSTVVDIVEGDTVPERVYQLNIHLFPMSVRNNQKSKAKDERD